MVKVEFMDKIFNTKKSFEKYIRNIIYNEIGVCDDIKNIYPEKYEILLNLLKRHPNYSYKTRKMNNLKFIIDPLNKRGLKLIVVRNNDEESISWTTAIRGKNKSSKILFCESLRVAIEGQIKEFKKNKLKFCEICGCGGEIHVDHIKHFSELVCNFLIQMKKEHQKIHKYFIKTKDGTDRVCLKNKKFEKKWIDFHKKNATLRILCRNCNLKRKNSKITLKNIKL